ncbi:MAG: tRNA uridine-5-carboxymethylaminomethyl(34) synthesis GTPase MnmE [Candidatus Competibacteraceae bacterium]|uniref:tRNA modification GTPase MnmE n=1 Tax=Candidatus Contendobacter odensis Run_B_J11 TaxID=1400861 RepID=A0A7U7J4L4_9GAMM|nr:tRNA uridine-5-carboxymethylaminomethyl(34) synthesis GTPase MnmE [Candidatus Contendobacter odensis]MBK8535721.1 tRNA uridine-5-carboxymethylaminomethyl(34) synthesis GTPase MnmE [Candidatus Competibacteraceae bacterium]MBK8755221.1 tRNA uridine-5-carboxymethylaminomethyl(34) synthesis GTPase MnmE [Candidatus Competibacteraceae bacterium]CDH45366.1 GTPase involved in tRNA modification and in thiophene and furan oxidation [Candidatus Contendobacter odensis Run_B_J11]
MDTIAAIATPLGRGGIGVIRVSGSLSAAIAQAVCGSLPLPRQATFRRFGDGNDAILDEGIALYFPAPHSFTGEDVLELQGHGGPVVMDLLLARVLELGARPARPGEFSERAFLNDKLDLAQAEAIADLIASDTTVAARAALRSLQGAFSKQVNELINGLVELRIYVEAAIDFPEEEIDFLADGVIAGQLRELRERLSVLQAVAGQGRLLRDGMTVVIAGRPNVGKSSLLNHLAGRETAIVTAIAGTTRDVLREYISIDGMPLHIIDTAGLRDSNDLVEQEGIRRAWAEIKTADRILMVVDHQLGLTAEDRALLERLPAGILVTVIHNKIDLTDQKPMIRDSDWGTEILLSAKTEAGLNLLREHLKSCMGYHGGGEGLFMARRRHLEALERATVALKQAAYQLEIIRAGELVAEELREAQNALAEITGAFTSEDLLARIFSSFCIGK